MRKRRRRSSRRPCARSACAREGSNLDFLGDHPVEQGLRWLEEIYGVGRKIAAATLNFSTLRKRAMVVDTHVLRVLRRFGFVKFFGPGGRSL